MSIEHISLEEAIATERYDKLTGSQIAEAVKDPKSGLTAEMVAQQVRGLVEEHNGDLGAFVRIDLGGMMDDARETDQRVRAGDQSLGKAAGVPTTIKDTYLDKKHGAKAGTKKHYKGEDSYVVEQTKKEGGTIVGKTATPELALDTDTPGTKNPWDMEYAPRGSSGGAGVAAAMGMGHINYGSDGGGSGRTPAVANGVFGIKPKRDSSTLTELQGHIPPLPGFLPTIDVGVPAVLARTVADLALGLEVLKGQIVSPTLQGPLKLGIIKNMGSYSPDPATARAIDNIVEALTSAGHRVEEVPALDTLDPEALMRLIGLTFGAQIAMCVNAGPELIRRGGDWRKRIWRATLAKLAIGGMVKGYDQAIEKYAKGDGGITIEGMKEGLRNPGIIEEVTKERGKLKDTFNDVYGSYHGVISPLDFVGPFKQRAMITPMDDGSGYFDRTTMPAAISNLTGDAAIAMATELSEQGLPVGIQVMTPETNNVIAIGSTIEELIRPLPRPPRFSKAA